MLSTEFMCVFCTCTDYPHYTGIDEDRPVEINDDFPDPDEKWWIKDLELYESDFSVLNSGKELTENIINTAHKLLAQQFPSIKGFQSMIHCHHLDFLSVSEDVKSVQIFHTGRFYFVCQSCQFDGALLF